MRVVVGVVVVVVVVVDVVVSAVTVDGTATDDNCDKAGINVCDTH